MTAHADGSPEREPGAATLEDILGQTETLTRTAGLYREHKTGLEAFIRALAPSEVIFTGCGSALNVGATAAFELQSHADVGARALAASELVFYGDAILRRSSRPLLVVVSRSGRTTETILAAEKYAERFPGRTIVITCSAGTDVTEHAGYVFEMPFACDVGIPQTRSYTAMLHIASLVVASASGWQRGSDALLRADEVASWALQQSRHVTERLAADLSWRRPVFLGSGGMFPLATEASLKMVEMAGLYASAYPFLEVRHGPNAVVDGETLVVGLLSKRTLVSEMSVLSDMKRQGAAVAVFGADGRRDELEEDAERLVFGDVSEEVLRIFQYLPAIQMLALYRARRIGRDADRPPHVQQFIRVPDLERQLP